MGQWSQVLVQCLLSLYFWEAQFETTVRRSWAKLKSDPKLKGETYDELVFIQW